MTSGGFAFGQDGTSGDQSQNISASADHLLTTPVPEAFWEPDMVIYHDKCADGIVAAWACWKRWGDASAAASAAAICSRSSAATPTHRPARLCREARRPSAAMRSQLLSKMPCGWAGRGCADPAGPLRGFVQYARTMIAAPRAAIRCVRQARRQRSLGSAHRLLHRPLRATTA
jgi:hypothetical protein